MQRNAAKLFAAQNAHTYPEPKRHPRLLKALPLSICHVGRGNQVLHTALGWWGFDWAVALGQQLVFLIAKSIDAIFLRGIMF
jgi:hypothetical protein